MVFLTLHILGDIQFSQDQAVLSWLMRFNPMSYMVDGVRRAFYQVIPNGTTVANDYMTDILVVILTGSITGISFPSIIVVFIMLLSPY